MIAWVGFTKGPRWSGGGGVDGGAALLVVDGCWFLACRQTRSHCEPQMCVDPLLALERSPAGWAYDFMSLIKFYSNAVGVFSYFFLAFSVSVLWLWDGAETLWRSDTNKRTHDSDSESLFCETEIFGVCFSNPQHQSFSSLLARLGGCSPLLVHEAKKMCVALLLLKPNSQPCRLWRETMTCMERRTHCCPKKTSSVTLSRISSSLLQPSPVQHKYCVV